MKKSSAKVIKRNQKVSKARGNDWKFNLKKGWLDSQMNPTKLKIARVSKGLSQTVVANKLGLSLSTFGGIERGKRPVTKKKAMEIAKALSTQAPKLFKETSKDRFKAF